MLLVVFLFSFFLGVSLLVAFQPGVLPQNRTETVGSVIGFSLFCIGLFGLAVLFCIDLRPSLSEPSLFRPAHVAPSLWGLDAFAFVPCVVGKQEQYRITATFDRGGYELVNVLEFTDFNEALGWVDTYRAMDLEREPIFNIAVYRSGCWNYLTTSRLFGIDGVLIDLSRGISINS